MTVAAELDVIAAPKLVAREAPRHLPVDACWLASAAWLEIHHVRELGLKDVEEPVDQFGDPAVRPAVGFEARIRFRSARADVNRAVLAAAESVQRIPRRIE